jgi:hypothetical protein
MIHTRLDMNQIEMKDALSAPENTVHRERSPHTGRRGRPHLGRAVVRSFQNQTG